MSERTDDLQRNGLKLIQETERFCFGIDSVLLTGFAAPRIMAGSRVLDLGCGNGVLPVLLSAKTDETLFTGLEIQEEAVSLAEKSVQLNGLTQRIRLIHGDLCAVGDYVSRSSFDVCISNPPYVKAGSGRGYKNRSLLVSRSEEACTFEDVAKAASFSLKRNGRFLFVHRTIRLPEIIKTLMENSLTPREMRLIYPKEDSQSDMFLMNSVKGAGMEMKVLPPLTIYGSDGKYTREVNEIYGI